VVTVDRRVTVINSGENKNAAQSHSTHLTNYLIVVQTITAQDRKRQVNFTIWFEEFYAYRQNGVIVF
jgi:hypothetical protein